MPVFKTKKPHSPRPVNQIQTILMPDHSPHVNNSYQSTIVSNNRAQVILE